MIGLYAKIPFHSQIRKADSVLAAEILALANEAALKFRARIEPSDESFFLSFDESSGCVRLRAAEAARFLENHLGPLSDRLHGWNILLATTDGALPHEAFAATLRRRWYGTDGDGLFVESEALPLFAGYIDVEKKSERYAAVGFPYAKEALPSSWSAPALTPATLDRFMDETGIHLIGESGADLLLAIGPGSAPADFLDASLHSLYLDRASAFLHIYGAVAEASPYGPFLRALSGKPGVQELSILSGTDREALSNLGAVADFLRSSPFRHGFSFAIRTRIKLHVAARIRLYARLRRLDGLPAVVILEGLDRFPRQSLDLVHDLLGEGLLGEGLVVFGTAEEPPSGLNAQRLRIVAAPPPSPAAIAEASARGCRLLAARETAPASTTQVGGLPATAAALLAAVAEGDGFRLGLALRLAAIGGLPSGHIDTPELTARALATFPAEFAELALALSLADEVLDTAGLDDFLDAAGFTEGIRPLIQAQLARLGLVSDGSQPRLIRPEAALAAAGHAGGGGAVLRSRFSTRLLALHAAHKISPSEALFRRIDSSGLTPARRSRFYLDCVAADALFGPSEEADADPQPMPIEGLSAFLAASAAADAPAAEIALQALEGQALRPDADPLVATIAALSRAFDEYARGQVVAATTRTKPALIGLHGLGARRAEARAHRLLGLCALAQAQIKEGADYLSNAYELAEEAPDPLECILASYAEAGALLVLGDLRRASLRGAKAAEWARSAFRADWETACDFLAGRIAFELGRYAAAGEDFGRVRATSRVYGNPKAAIRAELWAGRAAAYAGDGGQARALLSRHGDDAEALWFLSELAFFEGNEAEAAAHAARALTRISPHPYQAADAALWTSGFDCLEARALGFVGQRSYLADQIGAFADFTASLGQKRIEPIFAIALRTREERLATLHPQAHLYHYYCFLGISASGGGPLEAATVFSKSFKALQTRTARMEEASLKNEYLENNRWNRLILDEARRHKLI